MIKDTTSSQKIAKRARKYFRKETRNEAREMGRMIGNAMKPKPRFLPWFVWMAIVKIVIKTK
jgi:hypothetical protein